MKTSSMACSSISSTLTTSPPTGGEPISTNGGISAPYAPAQFSGPVWRGVPVSVLSFAGNHPGAVGVKSA